VKKLKERTREGKAYAMFDVDLSIRLQYIAFRLIPLLLASTSSMEFLRMKESFAMNSAHQQG